METSCGVNPALDVATNAFRHVRGDAAVIALKLFAAEATARCNDR
jgi:hypothetical protein